MDGKLQAAEQRIWDRVLAQPVQTVDNLEELCQLSRLMASLYRRLVSGAQGPKRDLLKQLYEREQATYSALRGIQRLSGQSSRSSGPAPDNGSLGLEGCYRRTCRMAAEFTARSVQPEYGVVYRQLANQAEKKCFLLAQLLGKE